MKAGVHLDEVPLVTSGSGSHSMLSAGGEPSSPRLSDGSGSGSLHILFNIRNTRWFSFCGQLPVRQLHDVIAQLSASWLACGLSVYNRPESAFITFTNTIIRYEIRVTVRWRCDEKEGK